MSPVIRLGDPEERPPDAGPAEPRKRLRHDRVTVGGIPTRAVWSRGEGVPTVLLHGWLDNCDTWLEVLGLLAAEERPAIAYDLPGFGVAPPLDPDGDVLDQLVDFAARAVLRAAERAEAPVVVAGNSLGGWTALRLAEREELPIAGVVPIGPAGIRMAPAFFTIDRIPAVSQIIGLPAPVPEGVIRTIAGTLYRQLAFGDPGSVEQRVVDGFTRFTTDRGVVRTRLDYAKRLRPSLGDPFDAEQITAPVTVLWGERDRLCMPAGASELQEMLPHARIEMIPDCGHTPQIECPERVAAAIAELAGESA
jgi:pimeloyl-ACP methyl ester carboxylesterase